LISLIRQNNSRLHAFDCQAIVTAAHRRRRRSRSAARRQHGDPSGSPIDYIVDPVRQAPSATLQPCCFLVGGGYFFSHHYNYFRHDGHCCSSKEDDCTSSKEDGSQEKATNRMNDLCDLSKMKYLDY